MYESTLKYDEMFTGLSESVATQYKEIVQKLHTLQDKHDEDEAIYDDAPEEFLDALLFTLMEDPVELPSGNVVDRAVISRTLLSEAIDPFTRLPLTKEELKPLPELKQKIEEWKASKKSE